MEPLPHARLRSVSLEDVFAKTAINETEEKLACADSDGQRIRIVEQFFLI